MVSFSLYGAKTLPIPCVTLHPRKPYCFPIVHPQFTKIRPSFSVRDRNNKPPSASDYTGRRATIGNPQFTKIRPFSLRDRNNKPPSASDYTGRRATIGNPQFTKIRPFSLRDRNNKPPSSIYTGLDYKGRRVTTTIGDVVNKDALNPLIINGQVSGGHFFVHLLKRTLRSKTADFLFRILKASAFYLWILSFLPPFAISCLAGMPYGVLYILFQLFKPIEKLNSNNTDNTSTEPIHLLCTGKVVQFLMPITLLEADPNKGIEKERWEMIGQYIALNGGVVTAEEIAPYLDPQNTDNMDDESYMLPVLQLFNGHPELDEEGNILYHFPSVHCISLPRDYGKKYAGRWVYRDIKVDKFLKEALWTDRELSREEIMTIRCILIYNACFAIVCWLASEPWTVTSPKCLIDFSSPDCLILSLLKVFVVHLICSMVFTNVILYIKMKRNDKIIERNKAREHRAKALKLPNLLLKRKLLSARNLAWKASIGNDRYVYKNMKDLDEQQEYERKEWEQRFKAKEEENEIMRSKSFHIEQQEYGRQEWDQRFKVKEENEIEESMGLCWLTYV